MSQHSGESPLRSPASLPAQPDSSLGTLGDTSSPVPASQCSAARKSQVQHRARRQLLPRTAFPAAGCQPAPGWGAEGRGSCRGGSEALNPPRAVKPGPALAGQEPVCERGREQDGVVFCLRNQNRGTLQYPGERSLLKFIKAAITKQRKKQHKGFFSSFFFCCFLFPC